MDNETRSRLEDIYEDLGLLLEEKMPEADASPAWLLVARNELGIQEVRGPEDNPRIVEYHATTGLNADDDETPWCSSFVNWCLEQAGVMGTDSARARSWLDWGAGGEPKLGSVVVYSRPPRPGSGHVGFYMGREGGEILTLGGNQGNRVSVKGYPEERVLGYRWPV